MVSIPIKSQGGRLSPKISHKVSMVATNETLESPTPSGRKGFAADNLKKKAMIRIP